MADLIQLRRDVAQNWTTVNPVLKEGELGIETDTKRFKCGDGTTSWNNLPYFDRNYELDELLERVDEIEGNITTKVQPSGGTFYRYGVPTTNNWCSKFISNNIVGIVVETDDEERKFNLKNPATSGICIASGVGQRWNIVAPNGYRIKTYKIVATLRDGQPEGVVFLTPQGGSSYQILPNSDITINVNVNAQTTYFDTEDISTEPLDRQVWFKTFEIYVERTSSFATMDDVDGKQDIISDLTTIRSGAAKGATSLQPTAQTLNNAQKAQARENIGAAALNGDSTQDFAAKDLTAESATTDELALTKNGAQSYVISGNTSSYVKILNLSNGRRVNLPVVRDDVVALAGDFVEITNAEIDNMDWT